MAFSLIKRERATLKHINITFIFAKYVGDDNEHRNHQKAWSYYR